MIRQPVYDCSIPSGVPWAPSPPTVLPTGTLSCASAQLPFHIQMTVISLFLTSQPCSFKS
jgi:hypothetical protein